MGPPTHTSTTNPPQILENWRTKRIEPQQVDEVMQVLSSRKTQATETPVASAAHPPSSRGPNSGNDAHLSRGDIFQQIEEDRERHKRLRERRWVQAQPQIVPHVYSVPEHATNMSLPSTTGPIQTLTDSITLLCSSTSQIPL